MSHAPARLSFHGHVVGWGFLVLGLSGAALTLALLLFFGGIGATMAWTSPGARDPGDALLGASLWMMLGTAAAVGTGLLAVPSLLTGWSLLRGRPGAVPAALAISVLAALFFFPIGTALGGYAIWALCFDREERNGAPDARRRLPAAIDPDAPDLHRSGAGWMLAGAALTLISIAAFTAIGLGVPLMRALGPTPGLAGAGLTAVLGVLALAAGARAARASQQRSREAKERRLVRVLARGGPISVIQAASLTGEPPDACEAYLVHLVSRGHARVDVSERGELLYETA